MRRDCMNEKGRKERTIEIWTLNGKREEPESLGFLHLRQLGFFHLPSAHFSIVLENKVIS